MLPIKHRRLWTLALLGLIFALLIMTVPAVPLLAGRPEPITAAWQAAQAAGSYRFTSDVTQVTQPLATLTNVGRASRTEKLYLEGQNDLAAQRMELTLWSQGGSALDAASGLTIRSEKGKTFARRAGSEWQATDDLTGSLAPQGDFLSYLTAIKDVQAQPGESRGGIAFTRYTFTIDSPRFATYMHEQMEAALRARGELPPTLHLDAPTYFRDMVGAGELWVGADGLPLRQILDLQFPAQDDEQVSSQIVVNFSQFGFAQSLAGTQSRGLSPWLSASALAALPYALMLSLFAGAMLLIYFRRAHRLQMAIAILVIFAQVVGPILSTYTNVTFFDTQTAKAAAAKERQAEAKSDQQIREAMGTVEFNPHANPLEIEGLSNWEISDSSTEISPKSPNRSIAQSPVEVNVLAAGTPLPTGATNWWKAEGNGTDSIGSQHGTLNGSATFAVGMVGQAFRFDGSNGYVALPSNAFPFPTTGTSTAPFTLELWFKTATAGVILGQQGQTPYAALAANYVPAIYIGSDGKLRVEMFWNGILNPITSAAAVNNNTFQHLAVVYGNSTQSVYLNGTLIGSQTHTQTAYTTSYQYQWGTGFTQNWPAGNSGWSNFNGLIDEPTFYARALAQAEVQAIYNAGSNGKTPPDSGLDTDGDTLTDFAEVRIGTSKVISDTDNDGLTDNMEVNGFAFGGQAWYTDPETSDSNGDGQGDALEWGATNTGLRATPQDTDADGTPDLFDNDNDNDGVPDNKDLAPYTKGATFYNETTPLQLTLSNLTPAKPTFVEFQLRPQDEKQLWFAYNVLDWPQDSLGQVRDVDGKSYADVASSGRQVAANDANGDMKIVPMLEIRIPAASANLPAQADLTPFGINVNDLAADGQTKVAYVPLNLVTDEKTGRQVAFSGRMRYLPTGSWPTPHQVRLVWLLQALVDLPCDKTVDTSADCQADGVRNNVQQVIHSYYSDWSLSGLTVSEEHGADVAILYEDPAVDDNKQDDKAMWGLAYALESHFVTPRDDNNDGQRDLTLANFSARFDRDNNPTEAQRLGVANILQVVTGRYATVDAAIASVTMTQTAAILNSVFKSYVESDRAIKPLLFFAQENRSRTLSLDLALSGSTYVTQNGAGLLLNMAPSGQPAEAVSVIASMKWMAYCSPASGPVTLNACEDDAYWEVLEGRYARLAPLADDASAEWVGARLQLAEFYYTGLRTGYVSNVQTGSTIQTLFLSPENEASTTTAVRIALQNAAPVPLLAVASFYRLFPGYVPGAGSAATRLYVTEYAANIRAAITRLKLTVADPSNAVRFATPTDSAQLARQIARGKIQLRNFRIAAVGVAAAILMVAFQIASMIPSLPVSVRAVFGSLSLLLNIGINVVLPILILKSTIANAVAAGQSVASALTKIASKIVPTLKVGAIVGAVISVGLIWGFLIYNAVSEGLQPGSPALNRAFFEAVASTIVTIILFILAVNPIGLLISAIIGIIDGLLTLTCELGVKELRKVPGLGGACFTLTGTVTKALTKLLYSYDLMINLDRTDLVVTDSPQVALATPSKGYAVGNSLSITLPVTTTVVNKDPDPNNGYLIYPYLYLFSQENLKRSTFNYSLTKVGNDTPAVALGDMTGSWQNVVEDHKYIASPMYRGSARSTLAPLTGIPLSAGINASVPFTLNMAYAIPAYECWTLGAIPICYTREFKGDNHMPITSLVYDVFPATLGELMTMATKPDGGWGLAWDAKFPSLRDADGDGLLSFVYNGLDPNDNAADSDNDGLTDRFELEKQAAGQRSSPIQIDSDNDGLTDFQEARLGANPAAADSDNDGLKDGEEIYHLRYDPTTGLPTTIWEGGWTVTINAATPFTVRVSADPLNADGDNDGVNDLAERQLAQDANPANRVDNQNRPYHPNIANTPPLAVLVATDDLDGYVAPGQSFRYTSTVIANTAVAPGILTVNAPTVLGGNPNPLALRFDPLTFNTAQTVTQAINQVVSTGIGTQAARISSMVNTRLPSTGAGGWRFAPITAEAPLTRLSFLSAVAASRPDRQDSYWLADLSMPLSSGPTAGDLVAYNIPGGSVRALENDNNNTTALLHPAKPSLAVNANGDRVAVWGQQRLCNGVTINSIKVVTAGSKPVLTFQTGSDSEQNAWAWTQGTGGSDVPSGTQFGPNASGFPVTLPYCGTSFFKVYQYNVPPTPYTLIGTQSIDPYNQPTGGLLTFIGGGARIELNVTVLQNDVQRVAGTLLPVNAGGAFPLTFPRSPIPKVDLVQNRNPVVASDGNGFLTAYESFSTPIGSATWGRQQVVIQTFDKFGSALGQSSLDAGSLQTAELNPSGLALAAAWTGSSYRIVWQNRHEARLWQVWANANGQLLTTKESIATDAQSLALDSITFDGKTYAPGIAYDPVSGRTLITYLTGNRQIKALVYSGNSLASTQLLNSGALSPQVAWHPGYQGWLLSYQDSTAPANHLFVSLDRNGAPAFPSTTGFTVTTNDNSLACPAPQSAPVVDLRWEELPGDNSLSDGVRYAFADASGYGNHALCSLPGCPAAGVSGAPNAPLSDYALQFDGVDDALTIDESVAGSFTVLYWVKATPGSNPNAIVVDQGANAANGWTAWVGNGRPGLLVDGQVLLAPTTNAIDDGAWHMVAATRNQNSSAIELYVDGNPTPVASGSATTAPLTAFTNLVIGRDRAGSRATKATIDHLQIFPTALAGDAIQAIYNRTNQSYCLAAGAANNNLYWSKVQASQPDVRGGRISASNGLTLTIDGDLPTASFTNLPNGAVVAPGQVIGGSASDATSGVGSVAVSINNGAWLTATGANSWAFSLAGYSGAISLRVRATDNVGNVGNASTALNLTVDNVAPTLTINTPATTLKPSKNAAGRWQVPLSGTANDANGIQPASLLVNWQQQSAFGVAQSTQPATLSGSAWSSNYLLNDGLYDPTGAYTVTVQAADRVGNRATPATTVVRLDARGPEAVVNPAILARQVITPTLLINGVVSDTNSIAGIDKLEIAFTPIEQIAALPIGLTSEQAEALLNRTWTPVTLAQRGAGVARTTWSFRLPAGLENSYQIDLRGFDLLGNVAISSNVWRGVIDTRIPRTALTATVTGASYFDTARNQRLYEVRFLCGAQDRYLNEATFTCPGKGLVEPVRSFDNNPALQALFPDLTIRTGLALSYTLWTTSTTPSATVRACDLYGRCGTKAIGAAVAAGAAAAASVTVDSAAAEGKIVEQVEVGEIVQAAVVVAEASASAPLAVIVNPTKNSFVAAGNAISVTVAAEAGAGLKEVTIKLDNATVQTLSFAQSPAITRTVRTVNVPVATEGPHTLVAQATAWDNSTQSTLFPVVFTLDQNPPSLTIDASALTIADTWVAQSGVLRFNGNASDSVGLAAVQIKEGDNDFTDATFGNGAWRVALPVEDPEGRTLNITVRAIDRAGRITTISQQIATDLSAVDAPDTSISSGPANPSAVNSAQFVFAGSATAVAFDCQLDEGAYTPCASPTNYSDLSKGSHTFRVRAIDGRGLPDLSPAAYTWTVNATALDVTITNAPASPTSSRSATFAFSGNGASYECSLDGAAFAACVSPANYSGVSNGQHTFLVRARNGSSVGAAARHLWTVVNAVPVAASQTISTTQDKAVAITLTAADEDALTYRIVSQPDHGLLLGAPPALSYTPNTGFVGMDSFTFVASDGQSESAPALVTINVGALPPPTTASVTILLDMQPNSAVNQSFVGSLGTFMLDDASPDDNDGITNRRTFTVAPGSYTVRHNKTTWVTTALACTPNTGAAIDLNAGSVALTLVAGDNMTCTFTQVRAAQITARAFEDRVRIGTNLGKRNAGDPWLPGWSLTLFTAPGAPVATLVTEGTAVAGLFEAVFRFLRPGAYMLCTTLPAGWTTTTPPAIDPAYGQACKPVTLNPGQAATLLFGAYPPVVAAESESFTPEEEVITDDDTIVDLPEETTEATPVETPMEAPVTTPGAMVNQLFLPLAAR